MPAWLALFAELRKPSARWIMFARHLSADR
jgi:hypothetical protein